MAYEALDNLQQLLDQILERRDDLITHSVKLQIISIRDQSIVLQLNLQHYPNKERIREEASKTHKVIEYLFSEDNVSTGGNVRLARLRELAVRLKSAVGDVVDCIKGKGSVSSITDSADVSSSSRFAIPCRKHWLGEYCTIEAYEALDNLQQTLDQILEHRDDLLTHSVKQEIISILDQSVVLQLNLKHYPYKEIIREAASRTHKIIEYLFSDKEIKPAVKIANRLRELAAGLESIVGDEVDYINGKGSASSVESTVGDVVGFGEDVKVIKDRLCKGSSKLQVLPIVGTGGIGKTTLAKIVYNDPSIMKYFSTCAWVTISQDHSVEHIVLNLLASTKEISAVRDAESDIPMESLIRKRLELSRYLIVIDDMWTKKAWDDVKVLFPDADNGSRIIVTTRLQDVAAYVNSSSSIHTMRLLDAHHSWNLLKQKVYADKDFPIELEDIGKKIVQNCRGLPLSIVVVAGLLSKVCIKSSWEQIAANDGQLETIICLSNSHLPNHLKLCLLYMAGFPEDYEIRVSELIHLWISEGFVTLSHGPKSLEEEAEDCIEDLVERSLVLVTNMKSDGKIKSCSLHDTVREFLVKEAAKEKVILSVMDYLPTPILRKHFVPRLIKDHHSISASSYDLHLKDYEHSSHIRTIICIPKKGYRSEGIVEKFSSLRVLHVLRRNNHWDWEAVQVFDLVHLTYLASNIPNSIVPSAISKLQNLQTLIIYRCEVHLPMEIWRLRQLRHLIAFSFQPLPNPEGENNPLENLQELSLATDLMCSKKMVEMIPNIKRLGICYSKLKFDADAGYCLHNLKYLCQLEKLKLEMHVDLSCINLESEMQAHGDFSFRGLNFPLQLRRLTLSGWRLSWSDMTIIGSLPKLQVLKLRNYACKGEHWETIEGEFRELRYLQIDGSHLVDWITESSHFPKLECIMLRECRGLHEIPSNIGDIPTLKLIEVDDKSSKHLLRNAKWMEQNRKMFGSNSFQVRVKRSAPFEELNYLAEGNDSEFLNVDDDDLADMDDDYNENTGWSSRTRVVSKYLQSAFIKKAECGMNALSLDNLLIGKSRKEA